MNQNSNQVCHTSQPTSSSLNGIASRNRGGGWGGVLQFSESLVFLTFVFQDKSKILREIFLVKEIICYTMGMLLNFTFPRTKLYHFTFSFVFLLAK